MSVTGPSRIVGKGTYTWSASADGGVGGYAYQWKVAYDAGGETQLGTQSTQSLTVYGTEGNFTMIATVTSSGQQASDSLHVYNCIYSGDTCMPAVPVGGTTGSVYGRSP